MPRPFPLAALLLAFAPSPAHAAGAAPAPEVDADAVLTSTDLPFHVTIPRGTHGVIESFRDAEPGQVRQAVSIRRGGDVIARLELFEAPSERGLLPWLKTNFGFLLVQGRPKPATASAQRVPAVTVAQPGGQAPAQQHVFWKQGRWVGHVAATRDDALAMAALQLAARTFDLSTEARIDRGAGRGR